MQDFSEIKIRSFAYKDFPSVREIYRQGIDTGNATFENHISNWEEWDKKFIITPRLVAICDGNVAGWAMLSRVSAREVYTGVCEVSIYIHNGFWGRGIGKILLKELIIQSEENNIWTLQAGIFPENISSIRLHLSCGFREIGYREKIGKMPAFAGSDKAGIWRNTILLERRSRKTGIN